MYLSSFRMGGHPERLLDLIEGPTRAAVIANAMDGQPDDERTAGVEREVDALRELGLEADELDLREYFGAQDRLVADLLEFALVWLRGGNVFMLRHALAASGGDSVIADLVRRDELVYAGYSAGPCAAGPTLRGLELVDDPDAVRVAYGVEAVWHGLGLLDFVIVPHYRSPDHPESERVELVVARLQADGVPYRTLRDGEALLVDAARTTVV